MQVIDAMGGQTTTNLDDEYGFVDDIFNLVIGAGKTALSVVQGAAPNIQKEPAGYGKYLLIGGGLFILSKMLKVKIDVKAR